MIYQNIIFRRTKTESFYFLTLKRKIKENKPKKITDIQTDMKPRSGQSLSWTGKICFSVNQHEYHYHLMPYSNPSCLSTCPLVRPSSSLVHVIADPTVRLFPDYSSTMIAGLAKGMDTFWQQPN